ncbi:hypothetical protein ACIQ9T_004431, partial [Escherichia coli]
LRVLKKIGFKAGFLLLLKNKLIYNLEQD